MDLTAPPQPDRVDTSLGLALERELEPGERILWSGKQLARLNLAASRPLLDDALARMAAVLA